MSSSLFSQVATLLASHNLTFTYSIVLNVRTLSYDHYIIAHPNTGTSIRMKFIEKNKEKVFASASSIDESQEYSLQDIYDIAYLHNKNFLEHREELFSQDKDTS